MKLVGVRPRYVPFASVQKRKGVESGRPVLRESVEQLWTVKRGRRKAVFEAHKSCDAYETRMGSTDESAKRESFAKPCKIIREQREYAYGSMRNLWGREGKVRVVGAALTWQNVSYDKNASYFIRC